MVALDRIPLLFCGKITLEDLPRLVALMAEGLVEPPRFLPPPFVDLSALSAWLAYSNFMNRLDLGRLETELAPLLADP